MLGPQVIESLIFSVGMGSVGGVSTRARPVNDDEIKAGSRTSLLA
jgi:hypothetical protein